MICSFVLIRYYFSVFLCYLFISFSLSILYLSIYLYISCFNLSYVISSCIPIFNQVFIPFSSSYLSTSFSSSVIVFYVMGWVGGYCYLFEFLLFFYYSPLLMLFRICYLAEKPTEKVVHKTKEHYLGMRLS